MTDEPKRLPAPQVQTSELEALEHFFEHGDVIRWTDRGYTYAAVWIGDVGKWYLSGGQLFYGTAKMVPEQLVKVLLRSHVDRVEFATAWTTTHIN